MSKYTDYDLEIHILEVSFRTAKGQTCSECMFGNMPHECLKSLNPGYKRIRYKSINIPEGKLEETLTLITKDIESNTDLQVLKIKVL